MKEKSASAGIGFCDVLLIVFIVLKLVGVITWGWVWVLAPFWIPAGLAVIAYLIMVIAVIIDRAKDRQEKKKRSRAQTVK